MFFEHQPKFAKNGQKTITFHILQTQVHKKTPFCCNPPFDQNLAFFNLGFLKPKTMMLNKNITVNQQKNKDKKKGFQREKKTGNQKRQKLMKENFVIAYFDVVLLMKQKQRRKKRKDREKNKEAKESKKERQEGKEKRTRRRERQRKKNWKRGRPKKTKEKQRETLKNKQKMPFSRGKTRFFVLQSKERKGTKTNQNKQNNNK